MKYLSFFFSISVISMLFSLPEKNNVSPDTPVATVLEHLGDKPVAHLSDLVADTATITAGKAIFLEGLAATTKGKKTKKQSRHFVCTSCHNIDKEDPDLSKIDPQAKLEYAKEKKLPFLQGTTMYGIVNRTSFYNGDYYKKYGALVNKARNDLREAIQLCAVECAQGRALESWEIESILAFLWTRQLKLSDLNLTATEYKTINAAYNKSNQETVIKLIKSKYLQSAPATFVAPPEDRKKGVPDLTGNPENGKLVYDLSCKHCHEGGRYSFYKLDDSKMSLMHLDKHFSRYSRYSTYQVTRWGTQPIPGKRAYMPQYTLEKLSVQQLEDLRAYFNQKG